MRNYEVIIVGGGHSGCEAAYVSAKMAGKVLLLTGGADSLGRMSCNPAVGGLAKGQIVKEIDALGGIMGTVADKSGIQFRLLNRSKGPAVRSTRIQCDRKLYETNMSKALSEIENIDIAEKMVTGIIVRNGRAVGVKCDGGEIIYGRTVILATGTFLNGLIHIGMKSYPAGRYNEKPAIGLTENLKSYGIKAGRLKTGTPPRIDGKSIDFDKCIIQKGEYPPPHFSKVVDVKGKVQLPCYLTYTNERTHRIIRGGLDRSPLFRGVIEGVGPRYCPSIEDKVVRFPDKVRHQLFLEPEGLDTDEIYINGFSSSLPEDIQYESMKTIPGLENVKMNRPGYAIEYDYFPSSQIKPTMESKIIENLYFAGQINGTSGYEEAAAQGLMAGINAILKLRGEPPFVLKRSESYIGVLIDDLTRLDIDEPYRMFTSRAEYRLLLREDNARERLSGYAFQLGLISKDEYDKTRNSQKRIERMINRLKGIFVLPAKISKVEKVRKDRENKLSLYYALKIPGIYEKDISKIDKEFAKLPLEMRKKVETEIKYSGYIKRELREIEKFSKIEEMRLDTNIDYREITGLKAEAIEKLNKFKPYTLGQGSRIAGVSPGDLSVLLVYLRRRREDDKMFPVKQS